MNRNAIAKRSAGVALIVLLLLSALCGCAGANAASFSYADVPPYSGAAYAEINGNHPFFKKSEWKTEAFETYAQLDALGRCGTAYANVCPELMPEEEREAIGNVKPSGWHTVRYDEQIPDRYLYNRCHLIAFQLAGENANECNLITGTRALNLEGMLPFENLVAQYVRKSGNHVLYRVTPCFEGDDLVARGVLMEAFSVEDRGAGVCFCVFAYNVQPGIVIDYATGESALSQDASAPAQSTQDASPADVTADGAYIGNVKSGAFHLPTCPNLPAMHNRITFQTREEALSQGYHPCGNCNP